MRKLRLKGMYAGLVVKVGDHLAARAVADGRAEYADLPEQAGEGVRTAEAAPDGETAEAQHAQPKGKRKGRRA